MKIITEPAQPVTQLRGSRCRRTSPRRWRKALEKLPADRFESAKAFADALANASIRDGRYRGGMRAAARERSGVPRVVFAATAGVALLASAGFLWSLRRSTAAPDEPVVRVSVDLQPGERLYPAAGGSTIAISPQGDRVVYVAQIGGRFT